MGWFWLVLGAVLVCIGWDAAGVLVTRRLTSREVAERLQGPGAPEMPEHLDYYARTKLLIQGSSLAQLIAIVFSVVGLAAIAFGVMLLLE